MVSIKQFISFILSISAFASVFYSVGKFMLFLSTPVINTNFQNVILNHLLENKILLKMNFFILINDLLLILLFIFQHSFMKSEIVKSFWRKINWDIAERSVYNLATSGTLLLLLINWQKAPSFVLWHLNLDNCKAGWWTFIIVHVISWIIIYGGSLIMDLAEILGIKQVFYNINNWASPINYKSLEHRRLYSHVRHPSFIGISTVLWATNHMSLDRLILAVIWTIYMYIAWSTDAADVSYQKSQLSKKKIELSRPIY